MKSGQVPDHLAWLGGHSPDRERQRLLTALTLGSYGQPS